MLKSRTETWAAFFVLAVGLLLVAVLGLWGYISTTAPLHPEPDDLPSLADQVFTVFEGGFVLARATNDWSHLSRQLGHLRHYMELLLAD